MPDTHDTRAKQSKPTAVPRQPADDAVLRARPVKGKVDYAELSREHIARYPKIRARLAE
jgi:hypothetical protein